MDFLLRRRDGRTSKIKSLSKLAISRIAILKRQREVRFSHARSDVIELLNLGHLERALLRTVYVIEERNMLDVFSVTEAYCHILVQKISLIKKHDGLPDELRESIASLVYAASRCGEFPELQELRLTIARKYGKEVIARAVELPDHSGVNPEIIQKLSMRQPSFDSRLMALKEIASENRIPLHLVNTDKKKNQETDGMLKQPEANLDSESLELNRVSREEAAANEDEQKLHGVRSPVQKKYRDVAGAALDAFESAAYAAAAAKAAVSLSRSESDCPDHHDDRGSSHAGLP